MSCKPKVPDFEPWTYILAYRYQKQNGIKLAQRRSKTFLYYDPSHGYSSKGPIGHFMCSKSVTFGVLT